VLCSEIVIRCRNCVGCSELAFAAKTESFVAKLCVLQRIVIRCRNYVVCSELTIRYRVAFCSELAIRCQSGVVCSKSLPKLSWLQQNCDSLSKLSCLLRVSICCQNCGASSETVVAAELAACSETVLAVELAACSETVLAAELGSLQRTISRCQIGCLQRTSSCCRILQ